MNGVNWPGVWAIFHHEMTRFFRTIMQSLLSPVVSTVLYFVVFGAAIGGRIQSVEGVAYGAFIVPGLMMLTILQQSVSNASFGIYFPKFSGTIYEYLVSPVGWIEVTLGFVGAAAAKAVLIALLCLTTKAKRRGMTGKLSRHARLGCKWQPLQKKGALRLRGQQRAVAQNKKRSPGYTPRQTCPSNRPGSIEVNLRFPPALRPD